MPQSVTNESGSIVRGNWTGKMQLYSTHNRAGESSGIGFLQGIAMGSYTSVRGDSQGGKHLQIGVTKSISDGFPASPSLMLTVPGSWRFRWAVKSGPRSVYVWAMQNSTGSANRPSMIIKSNSEVGLNADLSASAAEGEGWKQVGPINFTATGNGVVWVELHNNYYNPAPPVVSASYFDHIITT